MRTFEQLIADQERYKESGCPKSKVKEYQNCEFESLLKGAGPIILKTSCMPLHISLGIGLKVLNTIEEETFSLDNQIKAENGQQTGEISEIMRNLEILTMDILDKNEKLQQTSNNLDLKTSNLNKFEKQDIKMLEKVSNGKSYCDKSDEAKKVQQHKEQVREIKALEKGKRAIEKETEVIQKNFESSLLKKGLLSDKVLQCHR